MHAATYTIRLGGRCRIQGSNKWISTENNKKQVKSILPTEFTENFFVDGLDFSKTVIKYDGLSNLGKDEF